MQFSTVCLCLVASIFPVYGRGKYGGGGKHGLTLKYYTYSKTSVKRPLKNRQNTDLNDKWLPNEGRKYCRMLPLEHSAILLTFIKR